MAKKFIEERKFVSKLINLVLIGSLPVREALLKFPKDVNDSTLRAAYHALVHYEADEDFRARDLDYREEQDDFLEFVSQTLQNGEDLPRNIIKSYDKYHSSINPPFTSKNVKGFLKSLCKFLNV